MRTIILAIIALATVVAVTKANHGQNVKVYLDDKPIAQYRNRG